VPLAVGFGMLVGILLLASFKRPPRISSWLALASVAIIYVLAAAELASSVIGMISYLLLALAATLFTAPHLRPLVVGAFALWTPALWLFGPTDALSQLHLVNVASLAASAASAVLVAIGLRGVLGRTPLSGYRMLERALFISIFVSRLFAFVESQFAAVFGLMVDLLLLAALHAAAAPARDAASSAAVASSRLSVAPAPA